MADSFFGFNTIASVDDGGDESEAIDDDYDAFNDETFGAAINTDWEDTHENLVRMHSKDSKDDDFGESDLEINLSRVGLEDCEIAADETEAQVPLDPSVWASPEARLGIYPNQSSEQSKPYTLYRNPDGFMRQNYSNPFEAAIARSQQQHINILETFQHKQKPTQQPQMMMPSVPPKIISVEDIERNIRNQQQQSKNIPKTETGGPKSSGTPHKSNIQGSSVPQYNRSHIGTAPPGLSHKNPQPIFSPHHLPQKQPTKSIPCVPPPGFSPLHRPTVPPVPPPSQQQQQPNLNKPTNNLPVALNNFAMHPNFNAMRPMPQRFPHPPPPLPHPMFLQQQQNQQQQMQQTANQYNQRLVQEIQQNHPMLPFNRMNNLHNNGGNMPPYGMNMHQNMLMHQQYVQHQQMTNMNHMMNGSKQQQNSQQQQQQQHHLRANGNMNDEYDEYANLMSNRDKQWLIGIQLSQLNTDTPYIDDYYYTVFKERRSKQKGERQSKTHKDNKMNHPLTQPKGHAHLVLISMGNKNGTNPRIGQNNRERKNSESNKDKEPARTYTPLQFENSLGKLQCGSVTAPRKIIDMDIVNDTTSPLTTTIEISAQRKSRQLLLHIETLYRVVLKLEDFSNPTAIAAAIIVRERKEKERQMAIAQDMLDNIERDTLGNMITVKTNNSSHRSSLSERNEDESQEDLLLKLVQGLTSEKVANMMTVRKGKTLIKRIMPLIINHSCRWDIWTTIFTTLPMVIKKDKDDIDGILFALFDEFKDHVRGARMEELINIANALTISDKRINYIFMNKFCISCIIVLILAVESIYATDNSTDSINTNLQLAWTKFLTSLSVSVAANEQTQTISATIDSNVIKPLVSHFSRFRDLKLQQLLAVLTQRSV